MSAPDFSALVTGDEVETEAEGFVIRAKIVADETGGLPWEVDDGHGEVSDWRRSNDDYGYPAGRPGELVLCRDGRSARFYDFAAACRTARADGWGVAGGKLEGETAKAYAARAALADFARLRDWCNDVWSWVGVVVTAEREELELGRASLWGIESDAGDYLAEVAAELLPEALADARATLAKLVAT